MNNTELRLYTFTNFYLSQIQIGIQSAHLIGELFNDYVLDQKTPPGKATTLYQRIKNEMLVDWSLHHKTMIVLNGGNSLMLTNLYEELMILGDKLNLPVSKFHEDEQSLNNALTCVGLIIPDFLYDAKKFDNLNKDHKSQINKFNHLKNHLFKNDIDYFYSQSLDDEPKIYLLNSPEAKIINLIKSYRFA